MKKIRLFDVVVLTKTIPEEKLQKGAIGTVVEVLDENEGVFLVEFADKNGEAYAILDLSEKQLMKVVREPLAVAA